MIEKNHGKFKSQKFLAIAVKVISPHLSGMLSIR